MKKMVRPFLSKNVKRKTIHPLKKEEENSPFQKRKKNWSVPCRKKTVRPLTPKTKFLLPTFFPFTMFFLGCGLPLFGLSANVDSYGLPPSLLTVLSTLFFNNKNCGLPHKRSEIRKGDPYEQGSYRR
jgi:hypothetical protein